MFKFNKQYLAILATRFKYLIFRTPSLNDKKRTKDLIVSLTTYGKRLKIVHLAIETLLKQSVKPDAILLWISSNDLKDNNLPKNISNLEKRGLQIRIVSENIKSYKKLIYALKEYKNSYIITCDDDVFYPYNFIEGLWKTSEEFPGTIVAYRCSYIRKKHNRLTPYLSWKVATERGPSFNLFPTGMGGILYPPKSLNEEVFNKSIFEKLAPTADDVWFKFMGLKNRTVTVMVNSSSTEFPLIPQTQDESLWRINTTNKNNMNDLQINNLLKKYDLIDLIK